MKPHILILDPAVKTAELDCLNHLALLSPLPVTYHLPAIFGLDSLKNETSGIKGIVLLGSACSVNERLAWQKPLEDWLMPLLEKAIPTFGCCYGHQMLAHMFGGKVDYRTPDKKKLLGFREVEFKENPLWGKAQRGKLYVTHNEAVTRVPESMQISATSPEVQVDGLAHKTLPIWSLQAHPEATRSFIRGEGQSLTGSDSLDFGYSLLVKFFELAAKS